MKAEELMRFDWVHLVDDNTPRQVDWIRSGEVGLFWNKTVTPPYLEPIPLTTEILEKNGWVKDLYSVESYDNEELECLSLWVGEDGKNKWWWHVGVELVTPINYVHELQHALRLCGITREIIL